MNASSLQFRGYKTQGVFAKTVMSSIITHAAGRTLYIKVHDTDNIAIIVNNNVPAAGTQFPGDPELVEHIPQGHKAAFQNIAKGGNIIR